MSDIEIDLLTSILYSADKDTAIKKVEAMTSEEQLFVLIANYNWDDGFDIPKAVIANPACTKGVALLTFYRADGYRLLSEGEDAFNEHSSSTWKEFLTTLYKAICEEKFPDGNLAYTPEITNIQKFKLKKQNPDLPSIFLQGVEGELLDVVI